MKTVRFIHTNWLPLLAIAGIITAVLIIAPIVHSHWPYIKTTFR